MLAIQGLVSARFLAGPRLVRKRAPHTYNANASNSDEFVPLSAQAQVPGDETGPRHCHRFRALNRSLLESLRPAHRVQRPIPFASVKGVQYSPLPPPTETKFIG